MRLYVLFALLGAQLTAHTAQAAPPLRPEQFQASYLVSLLQYVRWPVTEANVKPKTFRVCFAQRGAVYETLKTGIELGETWARIWRKEVVAEVLTDPQMSAGCHILYLDSAAVEQFWPQLTPAAGTLTVSDEENFAQSGGMVELRVEGAMLNFVFNQTRIDGAGLVVSAQLSSLADRLERARKRNLAISDQ
jgi:hypothetical protein